MRMPCAANEGSAGAAGRGRSRRRASSQWSESEAERPVGHRAGPSWILTGRHPLGHDDLESMA